MTRNTIYEARRERLALYMLTITDTKYTLRNESLHFASFHVSNLTIKFIFEREIGREKKRRRLMDVELVPSGKQLIRIFNIDYNVLSYLVSSSSAHAYIQHFGQELLFPEMLPIVFPQNCLKFCPLT